ncbi:hypothetical protein GLA29479_284 [Lysobacter antibioticus]|nr:hypothetical protein GLA29479_284 [Lysobacter antibioticus]
MSLHRSAVRNVTTESSAVAARAAPTPGQWKCRCKIEKALSRLADGSFATDVASSLCGKKRRDGKQRGRGSRRSYPKGMEVPTQD